MDENIYRDYEERFMNISIITGKHMFDFINTWTSNIQREYQISVYSYDNFNEIPDLYSRLEDTSDGFLISGIVAKNAITQKIPHPTKPILTFEASLQDLFRLLLKQFIANRNLDPHRVIMDFLLPIRQDPSCLAIINGEHLTDMGEEIEGNASEKSFEELCSYVDDIASQIISLWKEGRFDLVICNYISIMPTLIQEEIPCIYAYPKEDSFLENMDHLAMQIQLNNMRKHLAVVISIVLSENQDDRDLFSLRKCISDYKKDFLTDFIINKEKNQLDIYTSLETARYITENFTHCTLSEYIEEKLHQPTSIGYGIGQNLLQAKIHAESALKEATRTENSFAIDENEMLCGPLKKGQAFSVTNIVTPKIDMLAKKAQLSPLTIQKILSIMKQKNSCEITSQELASRLNVTVRNANRILSNLEKNQLAVVAYHKSLNTKGRPQKVYQLMLL